MIPRTGLGWTGVVKEFTTKTGWMPGRIEHVAGAFRFTQYDFFRSWAMRWIASAKGEKVDPRADKEYTDRNTLAQTLYDLLAS